MQNLSMEQKAKMYNQLLFKYQRLQEQVRQIKAEDINLSEQNQRKIDLLEKEMKIVYSQTQRLY
jgi:uncharacterized protein involved in type VI secretion and phage assembly